MGLSKLTNNRAIKMEKLTSINIKSIVAKVNEIIDSIKSAPEQYDDIKLRKELGKKIAEITKRQDDLARTQNVLDKTLKAIEIPKVPSVEPLRKRIKALEDKPPYVYDDKPIKDRIKSLEDKPQYTYDDKSLKARIKKLEDKPQYDDRLLKERVARLESKPESPVAEKYDDSAISSKLSHIEQSIESLDKRLDFVKRTYSEKWETMQFAKATDNKELNEKLSGFESDIAELKKSLNEIFE